MIVLVVVVVLVLVLEMVVAAGVGSAGSIHHVMWFFFPAKILAPKNAKNYHITWRPWAFKTSIFGITWCDNFWPNLRLEVAESFHIRWRMHRRVAVVVWEFCAIAGKCTALVHTSGAAGPLLPRGLGSSHRQSPPHAWEGGGPAFELEAAWAGPTSPNPLNSFLTQRNYIPAQHKLDIFENPYGAPRPTESENPPATKKENPKNPKTPIIPKSRRSSPKSRRSFPKSRRSFPKSKRSLFLGNFWRI